MHGFVHRLDARPNKRASVSLAGGVEGARGPRATHRAAAVSAPTGGHGFGSLCVWRKGLLAGSARIVTLQLQRRPPCAGICVLVVSVHSAMFHPWRRLSLGGRDRWVTGSEAERGRLLPAATYADAVAHVSDSISMGANDPATD